jgi:hypothetical protein
MEKFYNNPAWRRIRGLRSFGILALSVAFCLTGLLALSSCDLEFWEDDDDEAAPEAMEMRGFYTSVSVDGTTDCQYENVDLFELGDVANGIPNVRLSSRGTAFEDTDFSQIGIKVDESVTNPETISSAYVSENTDGSFDRPGAYFLAATTDDAVVQGETIYTGYWAGYAWRPDEEPRPVVICPYVMVPASALAEDSCGTDSTDMHSGLATYLMDDDGLNDCHDLLDDNGVLSPTKR